MAWPDGMHDKYKVALEQLGQPLYGVDGATGRIYGFQGNPCRSASLSFDVGSGRVDVTSARVPQGGTWGLVLEILRMAGQSVRKLPWSVTLEERLVMLKVDGGRGQFRVIEASTGHWVAAGGYKKRHIGMVGWPGSEIDGIALVRTIVEFGNSLSPLPTTTRPEEG